MAAAKLDFEITASGDVRLVVDVVGGPTDLSGYTGSMMIREVRDSETVLAEVDPSDITIDALNRQVAVRIPGTETAAFDWRRGVYDLKIDGPDGAWFLIEGRVLNQRAVTRED